MKYSGMPAGMWMIFQKPFEKALKKDLQYNVPSARRIRKAAKSKYREIIEKLPEFEKADVFKTNIVNCAVLTAFLLCMDRRPTLEALTDYYEHAMTNMATKIFCKIGGRKKFTKEDLDSQKRTAALRAGDRNPYSWNMDLIPYQDGSGYEARFYTCGICMLMKEYGFFDLVPAMCHLDYTMSELGGASVFVRKHTLASGGPYCDCGYKKKNM